MLVIVTVLALSLVNTYGIGLTDCVNCIWPFRSVKLVLAENPYVNSTFVRLNNQWKSRVTWDAKLTKEALKEAKKPGTADALIVVRAVKAFPKSEMFDTTIAEKVEGALVEEFRKVEMLLNSLPVSSPYGCNGIYYIEDEQSDKDDVLTVACLYKAKRRSRE